MLRNDAVGGWLQAQDMTLVISYHAVAIISRLRKLFFVEQGCVNGL